MGDVSGIGRGDSIKPTGQNFSAPESPELKKTKSMEFIIPKSNEQKEAQTNHTFTTGENFQDVLQERLRQTGS
ncbi:MAG: hypothetical protein KDK63_02695 [Chlamydiia bacterium]|nr:hypothetical protein [Chlamydiia bacterium]MCB1116167.1 hypothetical protein [Chlamydiia bacterium]